MKIAERPMIIPAGVACAVGLTMALCGAPVIVLAEDSAAEAAVAAGLSSSIRTGWVVTGEYTNGVLQRYWFKDDGTMARDELVDAGGGWWAYATPEGYVVRGKWVDPETGYVYLADNDGRLEQPGWLVTDAYGDGLQRYWVDEESRACEPGFSSAGWAHYTLETGYVLRGTLVTDDGPITADNDGRLSNSLHGWVVTDAYGNGLQRYWFKDDGTMARDELVDAGGGWWAYATPEGYVVRGKWVDPETGYVYLADNDGRLEQPGWLVTDAYGDGLQRYWVDEESRACEPGFSSAGWAHYTLETGYVLRGTLTTNSGLIIANNDGRLAEAFVSAGWVSSSEVDGTNSRYFFSSVDGHLYAQVGFFHASLNGQQYTFYADDAGHVLTGKRSMGAGVLVANSEGVLIENGNSAGMVVTTGFDTEIQRYYLVSSGGHLYAKTGLFTVDGKQYYGLSDEGYVARNTTITSGGKTYRANNDGVLTEVASVARTRDPYLATVTWTGDTSYISTLQQKAAEVGSSSDYCIMIDNELCRCVVFERSGGTWRAAKCWNLNGGRNSFTGRWTVVHKQICNWDDSYFGKGYNDWSTCYVESYSSTNVGGHLRYIPGKGYEDCQSIHSTGYATTGWDNTGCIGLMWDNAKWIYENVPTGSTVYVFNYSDGTVF